MWRCLPHALHFGRISLLSVLDPWGSSNLQPQGHCDSTASELHPKMKDADVIMMRPFLVRAGKKRPSLWGATLAFDAMCKKMQNTKRATNGVLVKTYILVAPNFDMILRATETGETFCLSGKDDDGEYVALSATCSKQPEEDGAEVKIVISPAKRETRFSHGHFTFADRFCIEWKK